MNDLPRQALSDLIAQYGPLLIEEPRRFEGLLRDLYPKLTKEVNVLIGALNEGVAKDLMGSQDEDPKQVILARLAKRLVDNLAMSDYAAEWAVESWALALGVVSQEQVSRSSALETQTGEARVQAKPADPTGTNPPPATSARAVKSNPKGRRWPVVLGLLVIIGCGFGLWALGALSGDGQKDSEQGLETEAAATLVVALATAGDQPSAGWKRLGLEEEPISDISTSKGVIYVATYGAKHGIFKSEDLGESWRAVNNGLLDYDILQVEVSPENPLLVFSVNGGLWISKDGGATWFITEYGKTCGSSRSVALGDNSGRILIWSNCGRSAVSYDGGRNWETFGEWSLGDWLI